MTCSPILARKVAELLSETHREGTSPSSESNSWNQLFNKPSTLLPLGWILARTRPKNETVTEVRMKEYKDVKANKDE